MSSSYRYTAIAVYASTYAGLSSGLPDGLFSNQKSQFGKIFQGLGLENVDIFYGHLEHFTDIWDIL
jgi:hypothetical protein